MNTDLVSILGTCRRAKAGRERALERNLVDEVKTSDDYLLENSEHADLYDIKYGSRKPLLERMGIQVQRLADRWQCG